MRRFAAPQFGAGPLPTGRRRRSNRAWARLAPVALLGASLTGCPSSTPVRGVGAPGNAVAGAGVARIEVRRIEERPAVTLVTRDGDPQPALAVAIATGLEAAGSTAVAVLLEHRLRRAGLAVTVQVDRWAIRLFYVVPHSQQVATFVTALRAATADAVSNDPVLLAQVSRQLASLRRHTLDGAALDAVNACTGRLGVAPDEDLKSLEEQAGAQRLERWRAAALSVDCIGIAVVGPHSVGRAALAAVESTHGWPVAPGSAPAWPSTDAHGVYQSHAVSEGSVRLQLAVHVAEPQRAAAAVARLADTPSPLSAKLSALPLPWQLEELTATARPAGGCVGVTLRAQAPSSSGPPTTEAARATTLVRRELARQLAAPVQPIAVAKQIVGATDPREAAGRAAWWSLCGPAPAGAAPRWATALGVAPEPRGAAATDLAALGQSYHAAQAAGAQGAASAAPITQRAIAIEQGQGQLWVLLASPCALVQEGSANAGRSALGVLTAAAADQATDGVRIEPWITADGIGVLAHGAARYANEPPGSVARRVAVAAARRFTNLAQSSTDFVRARQAVFAALRPAANRYFEQFALAAAPDHPSWIAPLGLLDRHALSHHDTIRTRWREVLINPTRVAILANVDQRQAQAAAREIDHWLLPEARGAACRDSSRAAHPKPGLYRVQATPGRPSRVLVGAVLRPAADEDLQLAQLTAAALRRPEGPLGRLLRDGGIAARWSARIVGGRRAPALIVEASAAADRLPLVRETVLTLLARLGSAGLDPGDAETALRGSNKHRREARFDPRHRLVELWRGTSTAEPIPRPDAARWRAWIAAQLSAQRLIVVTDEPPPEPKKKEKKKKKR